jgi:hypothetical protein
LTPLFIQSFFCELDTHCHFRFIHDFILPLNFTTMVKTFSIFIALLAAGLAVSRPITLGDLESAIVRVVIFHLHPPFSLLVL